MSKVFFDIGACTGDTFDLYLTKHPEFDGARVYCFEPSPRHWAKLLEAAERHGARYDITLLPFGLACEGFGSPALFHFKEDHQADGFVNDLKRWDGAELPILRTKYTVRAVCLPMSHALMTYTCAEDEVTIKIDAEGCENLILAEIIDAKPFHSIIKKILVEWHPIGGSEYWQKALAKCGLPFEEWTH